MILGQPIEKFVWNLAHMSSKPFIEPIDEITNQQWDIVFALSERRQHDRKDTQSVVEVLPKGLLVDHLLKLKICGGDNPHINLCSSAAADPLELLLLETT